MKKITLSSVLIPLLTSTVLVSTSLYANQPAPKPVAKPSKKYKNKQPHYAVPPAPPKQQTPKPMPVVAPPKLQYAVPPLAPSPASQHPEQHRAKKPAKKYKKNKGVASTHKAKAPASNPVGKPAKKYKKNKGVASTHSAKPQAAPQRASRPSRTPVPSRASAPHARPVPVPPRKHKVPHGLTIHDTHRPVKPYKGHHKPVKIPKQYHGSMPVIHNKHKPKPMHPAVHKKYKPQYTAVQVHPVAKPDVKHLKGKTLHPKKHTTAAKHVTKQTIVKPSMKHQVQVAPMGSKKPVHHKVVKPGNHTGTVRNKGNFNQNAHDHASHNGLRHSNTHSALHGRTHDRHTNTPVYGRGGNVPVTFINGVPHTSVQVSYQHGSTTKTKTVQVPVMLIPAKGYTQVNYGKHDVNYLKSVGWKIQGSTVINKGGHTVGKIVHQNGKDVVQISATPITPKVVYGTGKPSKPLVPQIVGKAKAPVTGHAKVPTAVPQPNPPKAAVPPKILPDQKTPGATPTMGKVPTPMKTPPMPVPTQQIPQPIPTMYNNPTATGMKPTIMQKTPGIQNMKPGVQVTNNQGQVIGIVQKGANGQKYLAPATKGQVPGATPTIGKIPTKMKVPQVTPGIQQMKPGTIIKGTNGQPLGTVVKLPNGQKGIQPVVVPKPNVQGTPHVDPSKLKAPPVKGGNAQPMVQPKPSSQAIPHVDPGKLKAPTPTQQATPTVHPTPSAPNTVNGVKQTTPIVHPTPSAPNTVNGVKQVTPTVSPKPAGGNAKPTLYPKKQSGQVPVGLQNPNAKPTIQALVGTILTGKNGQPIGTVVKLPNGQKGVQPIAVPGAIPQLTPGAVPNNAVPHATPIAVPGMVPQKMHQNILQKTPSLPSNSGTTTVPQPTQNIPTPVTPPKVMAKPVSVPQVTPVHHQGTTASHSATETKPIVTGKHELKEIKRDVQDKIIEPGIRNKEVETYRTNDAKEKLYKDVIRQDDKNVTFSPKPRQ